MKIITVYFHSKEKSVTTIFYARDLLYYCLENERVELRFVGGVIGGFIYEDNFIGFRNFLHEETNSMFFFELYGEKENGI
jgi:hypothetical protein